jgi:hypothetical protein
MPSPILNEKAPAATIRKGLILISTTPRPQQKDAINDFIYHDGAPV